jgi:hypothetical protein
MDRDGLKNVEGCPRNVFAHELQVHIASLRIGPARKRGNVFIAFMKMWCFYRKSSEG